MFHELVPLVQVITAEDVPFSTASVDVNESVVLSVIVVPASGVIVVTGVWRSTIPV